MFNFTQTHTITMHLTNIAASNAILTQMALPKTLERVIQ